MKHRLALCFVAFFLFPFLVAANTVTAQTIGQTNLTSNVVMSARVVPEACLVVPLLGKNLQECEIVAQSDPSRTVRSALTAFIRAPVQI